MIKFHMVQTSIHAIKCVGSWYLFSMNFTFTKLNLLKNNIMKNLIIDFILKNKIEILKISTNLFLI